ncbi:MAG: hypothetical protein ACLQGJ_02940, partial [Candidatus Dormibacteria bacterium]
GDVPNGGPSYAFVECSCGWTSADLYGDEAGVDGAPAGVGPDPETQFREHSQPNPGGIPMTADPGQ